MGTTTQNDVTNALTTAIQTIAESNVQSKEATLVVEAEIVEIIDEGLGTYIVKYLGNKFNATTAHNEIIYEVGDMVYIIIPNGNFDKNKVILSPVTPSTAVYASTQDGDSYITIGDNLFKYINNVSLCTYKPHNAEEINIDTTGFAALFKAALTDSRTFNFTCKIQTNIEKERRSKGNYGLVLDIPVIQFINGIATQKYYSITIDTNNITGDPYDLEVPSLQNFYFTLPEDMNYNDTVEPKIKSFVKDFIGEDNTKPDDIFITDIQLLSTLEVDKEIMSGYYSVITASNGTSFLFSRTGDVKTLSIIAYLNGKITKVNNFDCYWFKENVTIDATSDKFQRFGGIGWEILNKVSEKSIAEDGKITYQYVTNIYTQIVSQSEIHNDTRFKCVLVKNDKIITSTIVIKNLASDATIELTSTNGSTIFPVGIGNVELQLKYYESGITDVFNPDFTIGYAWQRLDKKGNYIDNDFYTIDEFNKKENNIYYTKIHYPVSEIDEINTIYCTVYLDTPSFDGNSVKRQVIGTTSLTITIGESSNGRIIITNGDKLYKYDADGDSPMVADYDGPLTSTIKVIDPISIRIYKEDGSELTNDEYKVTDISWLIPINSMIKLSSSQKTDTTTNPGYYTIKGKYPINSILNYGIDNTYNKNKLDNAIIVQASAPSAILKETISGVANIKFLKDGESGTNGSKYSAIVTYNNYGYGEKDANGNVNKLQLIYVLDNNAWFIYNPAQPKTFTYFRPITLSTNLYVDGEKTTFIPATNWSIFDNNYNFDDDNIVSPIVIDNTGQITLTGEAWTDITKNFCATIEAKVTASQNSTVSSLTDSEEYVYAYYPIECTYVSNYSYLEKVVPSMAGGFSKVLYASDGTNPQYDNSENFYIVDNLYNGNITNLYNYNWSTSNNMKIYNNTDPTCKVSPTSKYDNGVAKNFVRVDISQNSEEKDIINNKINELNIKRDNEINRKNYYQILQNNIDIFGYFDYNYYIDKLDEASSLYVVKTNLIKVINQLLNQINNLYSLCDEYKTDTEGTDEKVLNVYNEVINKINDLNNLDSLCKQLGINEVIEQILVITPSNLIINNKINSSSKTCYITINDAIDLYNNTVNAVYSSYLNLLNDDLIINCDIISQSIVNDLNNFITNEKLINLTNIYYDCDDEVYRYDALVKILQGYFNSLSTQSDTYSYNLIIENVIQPIYDNLSWYISFYYNGGYNSIINEIDNEINNLTTEIEALNSLILLEENSDIIHIQPVIMVYNRYELSHINGWDGNKLQTNDGYLIAPQVGAGKKNNANQFTGIVIGVKQVQEKSRSDQKIGLFGYNNGIQSIFLNAEDGSATFGESGKGQVIIDPSTNKAIIKSGNYSISDKTGMQIDLSTPEIKFGSGNFIVSPEGHITAKGDGSIAGWKINDTQIYSNTTIGNGRLTLDSSGTGKIYSGSHSTINSTSSGFFISKDGLSIGSKVYINSDGVMRLGNGAVAGSSSSRYWTVSGSGNNSYISYGTTSFNSGSSSVYIGTDGISLGSDKFYVNRSGELTSKSGTIGGWQITSNYLLFCAFNKITFF